MVVDVIFVLVLAGGNEAERGGGLIGAKKMDFTGGVAGRYQKKIIAAAGARDRDAEALIFFVVQKSVRGCFGLRGASFDGTQQKAEELIGTFGDWIFDGVEEVAIVGGPGGAGDALAAAREGGAGARSFYVRGVVAASGGGHRSG